jgi:hypothetical protein
VSQNVDYDTFKNMVAVAHLKLIHAQSTGRSGEGMHACMTSVTSVTDQLLTRRQINQKRAGHVDRAEDLVRSRILLMPCLPPSLLVL